MVENQKDDPEERRRQEQRLATFLSIIRPLVTLKTGENLARINAEQRKELVGVFGQPTAEAIAEAAATGAVLWTDDLAVADTARHYLNLEKRAWTQAVFIFTAPAQKCIDLSLFLLQWRYFFTRVEPEVVLAACRLASWDPDAPVLKRVAEWLAMPELHHLGAARVCALSLRLTWREGDEVSQKQDVARVLLGAILARQDGRRTVVSIRNNLQEIMQGDHDARRQCDEAIEDVLRVKIGPGTESSKAAWAKVIRQIERKYALPNGEPSKQGSGPTPKQRAKRRNADRKRKKGK